MTRIPEKHVRVMAIAPSTRGFGFAVLEGPGTLLDWGVKSVRGDKNPGSLSRLDGLITYYRPEVMVLPDISEKHSRRAPRIKALVQKMAARARDREIRVAACAPEKVRQFFFADRKGTKHALAAVLAERFPQELASRLPPPRRPWMSEDPRMDMFEAVALAVVVTAG